MVSPDECQLLLALLQSFILNPTSNHYLSWLCSGFLNGTIGNFTNGSIGSQWYHWLTSVTNGTIGRASGTIGINGFTNGTTSRTLNNIGITLVPLVEP